MRPRRFLLSDPITFLTETRIEVTALAADLFGWRRTDRWLTLNLLLCFRKYFLKSLTLKHEQKFHFPLGRIHLELQLKKWNHLWTTGNSGCCGFNLDRWETATSSTKVVSVYVSMSKNRPFDLRYPIVTGRIFVHGYAFSRIVRLDTATSSFMFSFLFSRLGGRKF